MALRTVPCGNDCGQLAYSPDGQEAVCPACERELREGDRFEVVRLFEPGPEQMPGQIGMELL